MLFVSRFFLLFGFINRVFFYHHLIEFVEVFDVRFMVGLLYKYKIFFTVFIVLLEV